MNAIADVHQPVAVDVTQRDAAVAEIAVLKDGPGAGAAAEPNHDAVLLRVDVGRAVVADGDEVRMPSPLTSPNSSSVGPPSMAGVLRPMERST